MQSLGESRRDVATDDRSQRTSSFVTCLRCTGSCFVKSVPFVVADFTRGAHSLRNGIRCVIAALSTDERSGTARSVLAHVMLVTPDISTIVDATLGALDRLMALQELFLHRNPYIPAAGTPLGKDRH